MNIDSQTVSDLTNKFKDNADQLLKSLKNPPALREVLENAGVDAGEIDKFMSKFEQQNSGARASLAFGLIAASFVIFQM